MYIVKNSQGETVLIATRKEDAQAYLSAGAVDKTDYTIEEEKEVDND